MSASTAVASKSQIQAPSSSSISQAPQGGGEQVSQQRSQPYRINQSSPRNIQATKKQHKHRRQPGMQRDDVIDEVAMNGGGSRKGRTSITHLMDWTLPPRPQFHHSHPVNFSRGGKRPTWGLGSGYHAVDKARYVNANYRFIVHPDGDYRAQTLDPDSHIPWTSVLQVVASSQTQATSCPICLSEPVAPRMAKCGHIFCLPCLLRYMAAEDETTSKITQKIRWKKCPICYDSIYVHETRPVKFFTGQEDPAPQEGSDVVLRLMVRQPGATLALPKEITQRKIDPIPWHFAAEMMDYARIMKGTERYLTAEFQREIHDLEEMGRVDELMFGEEGNWVKKAIERIRGTIDSIDIGNPPELDLEPEVIAKRPPIHYKLDDAPAMYLATSAAPENVGSPPKRAHVDKRHETTPANQPYYFYQSLPHSYLSPLDIRILKMAFGSFAAFPSTILPRVENFSSGHVVDDDLRRRAKYLSHLPFGCEVAFLECNWTDIVPAEILEKFQTDIERRRKRKNEKETKEESARARAQREEDALQWASVRRVDDESVPVESFGSLEIEDRSELWENERPGFTSLPQSSPPHSRTVWGTPAIPTTEEEVALQTTPVNESVGWLDNWEADIVQAPAKGKKKFKKVTLMTNTGFRRA